MTVPVLLLTWKRPEELQLLLDSLRTYKPSKVYIASDGPRVDSSTDGGLILQARKVISDGIDWPCSVSLNYSSTHLGLKERVVTAISWFFSFEEMGIILEEDCIPHPTFFHFVEKMLDRYKDDTRCFAVNGTSFLTSPIQGEDYYFSKYSHCWGWGTWRRAWNHFDVDMTSLDSMIQRRAMCSLFQSVAEERFWTKLFLSVKYHNKPDSWAIRWQYTCLINHACILTPTVNLVSNIGINSKATHTKRGVVRPSYPAPSGMNRPQSFCIDRDADRHTFLTSYNGWPYYSPYYYVYLLVRSVLRCLRSLSHKLYH